MEVVIRPPSAGRMREGDFPPLVTPVADEGEFTSVAFATSSTLFMSADFRPKDVARGFAWNPLTPDRGLNSISPSRYMIDWGVCPTMLLTEISDRGTLPYIYVLMLSMQQLAGSRPIVDFIRILNVEVVAKFFSRLTQTIEILLYAYID